MSSIYVCVALPARPDWSVQCCGARHWIAADYEISVIGSHIYTCSCVRASLIQVVSYHVHVATSLIQVVKCHVLVHTTFLIDTSSQVSLHMHCASGTLMALPCEGWGVTAGQLDLPSVTPLSVVAWGRLHL